MPAGKFTYKYPRPAVTVDIVVVTKEKTPRVLLIRRGEEPFRGAWALPGGFVEIDEPLVDGARRELMEETGIKAKSLTQVATFGDPGRDPRGRTISVVYLTFVDADTEAHAGDDAADAGWFSLARPPKLAFDHKEILACVRKHLKSMS